MDVLTEDDLAICNLGGRRMRRPYAVNDEAHESSLHREHSPDQDHGSPMMEYRAQPLESAGEAAEILRREAAEYADLARRLEDLMGGED
jgi:hypothetical protein